MATKTAKTNESWNRAERLSNMFKARLNEQVKPSTVRSFFAKTDKTQTARVDATERFRDQDLQELLGQIRQFEATSPVRYGPKPKSSTKVVSRLRKRQAVKPQPAPLPSSKLAVNLDVIDEIQKLAATHGGLGEIENALLCLRRIFPQ